MLPSGLLFRFDSLAWPERISERWPQDQVCTSLLKSLPEGPGPGGVGLGQEEAPQRGLGV